MSKYQVMPPLSEDQFDALKADIASAGIRVPIEVDEHGEVIDGHHRRAIAMELGIECPEVVVRGLEEFEKVDRAFVLNATRRHFNREQHRAVVVKSLKMAPRLADREHARRCGVSHPTVSSVRSALEAAGQLKVLPVGSAVTARSANWRTPLVR
jgi:ParB-like chromosome segregation protein Spo0J